MDKILRFHCLHCLRFLPTKHLPDQCSNHILISVLPDDLSFFLQMVIPPPKTQRYGHWKHIFQPWLQKTSFPAPQEKENRTQSTGPLMGFPLLQITPCLIGSHASTLISLV